LIEQLLLESTASALLQQPQQNEVIDAWYWSDFTTIARSTPDQKDLADVATYV